jgi:hypothetical protein
MTATTHEAITLVGPIRDEYQEEYHSLRKDDQEIGRIRYQCMPAGYCGYALHINGARQGMTSTLEGTWQMARQICRQMMNFGTLSTEETDQ